MKPSFLLASIYIRFGTKLYMTNCMGTNCSPRVADLFLFCYERDSMMSLCADKDKSKLSIQRLDIWMTC